MILERVKPLGSKLLIKLLPLYSSETHPLGLIQVSQKKHYEQVRKAEVLATGPKVREVNKGETVVIQGHSGKWVDDPTVGGLYTPEPLYRTVEEAECLAVC